MFAIRLDKEIEEELDSYARLRGTSRSAVVREAIVRYLEDNEDLGLAEQALARVRSTKRLAQLREELGLDG